MIFRRPRRPPAEQIPPSRPQPDLESIIRGIRQGTISLDDPYGYAAGQPTMGVRCGSDGVNLVIAEWADARSWVPNSRPDIGPPPIVWEGGCTTDLILNSADARLWLRGTYDGDVVLPAGARVSHDFNMFGTVNGNLIILGIVGGDLDIQGAVRGSVTVSGHIAGDVIVYPHVGGNLVVTGTVDGAIGTQIISKIEGSIIVEPSGSVGKINLHADAFLGGTVNNHGSVKDPG